MLIICIIIFPLLDSKQMLQSLTFRFSLSIEPILIFLSVFLAASLFYPSLMSHILVCPLWIFPVWAATAVLLIFIIALSSFYANKGNRIKICTIIIGIGISIILLSEFSSNYPIKSSESKTKNIVLLGLDSLSHADDLSPFLDWAKSNGGTVYEKAVTPGLLTNSVWASLLSVSPVKEHGLFHVFQSGLPKKANLLINAKQRGYRTVAVFPDQFTCWLANESKFDEYRNGPIGWRQIAILLIENESVLLPLVRHLLPDFSFLASPKNHSGTFNYNLDRELDLIFNANGTNLFIASHITFLHSCRYPKYTELGKEEIVSVITAKAGNIVDRTLDWQHQDLSTDPIKIRKWKIRYLLNRIIASLERTKFLRRGGRLVLFSDHGDRFGLNETNFTDPTYHHVLLITFGLDKNRDPSLPISLLDIPALLGLSDEAPFPPKVEFILSNPNEWPILIKTAKIEWNGVVRLNEDLLCKIFRRLQSYVPYSISLASQSIPSKPQKNKTQKIGWKR